MKTDFIIALHSLLLLAFHENERFSSGKLAEKTCTNAATIRRLMSLLQKEHYIEATYGPTGGYRLLAQPESIRLGDLYYLISNGVTSTKTVSDQLDLTCLVAQHLDGFITQLNDELLTQQIAFLNTKSIADYLTTIQHSH